MKKSFEILTLTFYLGWSLGCIACGDDSTGGGFDTGADTDADTFTDTNTDVGDTDRGDIVAFPGAEGFGGDTPGGRGGRVIVVDTLDWEGAGSLSEALLATEPRIIVFRVSGVIQVSNGVSLSEANAFVTVAGQTSPGGITLAGSPDMFIGNYQNNFHDGVFRFLRFRGNGNYDNIAFNEAHHLIFDHCDFSGATDETFDITHAHNVTVQWSTISNSDSSGQNYGALIAYKPTANFTFHHNLFAHHGGRCAPHMHWTDGVPAEGAIVEFSNNVVYNCGFDAIMYHNTPDEGSDRLWFNLVGNYFKGGPDTPAGAYGYALPGQSNVFEYDTVYEGYSIWSAWDDTVALQDRVAAPEPTLQSAADAYERVLTLAGAFPRDPMNARTVEEVRNGQGTLGIFNDALLDDAPAVPEDADLDGMSDDWELALGLDPQDPSDAAGDLNGDGYTNIEEYINELVTSQLP